MVPLAAAFALAGCFCTGGSSGGRVTRTSGGAIAPALEGLPVPEAVTRASTDSGAETQFRNVDFRILPEAVLHIHALRGQMQRVSGTGPVIFDDKKGMLIRIATAEIVIDTLSLDHLMNDWVFAYPGAPLSHLHFGVKNGRLIQTGVLHKVIDIPFTISATVSLTPDHLIRVHTESVKIASLNGLGLMKALGVHLDKLLDLSKAVGISVKGNDLYLDPLKLLPPPHIAGTIAQVAIVPSGLEQRFDDPAAAATHRTALVPGDAKAANYMYFKGGTLRFGKLFMVDADMQIVDENPATPFDFSIDRYNDQLVAGYSKSQSDFGLEVFMPDLSAVK